MVDKTLLCEQIEAELKQDILAGRLSPGQRIAIEELAKEWGVSYTPVRDAIHRLEKVGFVNIAPRRGIHVGSLNGDKLKDIYDLRMALECLAVETATDRIPAAELQHAICVYREAYAQFTANGDRAALMACDGLVHDLIIHHCTNGKLVEIMADLNDLIAWARSTLVTRWPSSYEMACPEHIGILEALLAQDVTGAQKILRTHLKNSFARNYLNSDADARKQEE